VYERELGGGRRTYQQVADQSGITRAAICQYMTIINRLPADLIDALDAKTDSTQVRSLSMKKLLRIARLGDDAAQRAAVADLLTQKTPG
jgi:hypothetical protein